MSETVASGSTIQITQSNISVFLGDNVTAVVTGWGDTIYRGVADIILDGGNGNLITIGNSGQVTVTGSSDHDVAGQGSVGEVDGTFSGLTLGIGSTLTLNGSGNAGMRRRVPRLS